MTFAAGGSSRNRRSAKQKKASRRNQSRQARRPLRFESLESRELLAITPQSLLPDLIPWASQSDGYIYDWVVQGNDLRLTTAMANIGTGRMELRGGAVQGNTQEVMQRVYEPNGTYTDLLAGTFTHHPEHGHIHFDGFAEFRLRAVLPGGGVGDIVAAGDKVSFCLLDVERYNNSGPSSPRFLTCGQVQGISVGWADVYDRGLPGQSIDISTVPNGNYWLEVVVDPDNRLLEANENNNVARIQINLQRSGGGGTIPPDTFEPNNSFDNASILAPPEDHVYSNLTVHSVQDSDYFRVTASASGSMAFRVAFQNSQGDIELEVLDAARNRIGMSATTANVEQVSFTAVAGQYYYARIWGYEGALNPNYTLTVDQPGGTTPSGDQFEDNDTFATARTLTAADATFTSLSIDTANDGDYYRVVPTASGSMTVGLAFQHSQGDIDMQILSASQSQIGLSDSTSNAEQFTWNVTAGQAYYIRVFGYEGATNPNYSMTIDVPSPPAVIPPDSLEENDTLATARSLSAVDQTYSNLTIDVAGDDDFYSIVPTTSGTLNVSLALQNAQGNVDLQIMNSAQTQLGLSNSTGDSESLNVAVTAGETYTIRAFGASGATNPNYSMTVDVPDAPTPGAESVTYFSTTNGTTVASTDGSPSLSYADADIVKLTVQTNGQYGYQLHFDGSDVGLTTSNEDVDAFEFLPDGSIIVSTVGSFSVPAPGGGEISGTNADLLRFVPTSLGATTAGAWSMYFDGSDVSLSSSSENIDAVAVLDGGNIVVSTTGGFSAGGVSGQDEDLFLFTPTTLGSTTAGSWAMYFDGSDVGLSASDEDVDALDVRAGDSNPTLYFSTVGNYSVTGASGADEDAFAFTPTSLGSTTAGTFGPSRAFDGSLYGLDGFDVDGIHLVPPVSPLVAPVAASLAPVSTATTLAGFVMSSPAENQRAPQRAMAPNASAPATSTSHLAAGANSRTPLAASSRATTGLGGRGREIATSEATAGSSGAQILWDHLADSLDEILRPNY